MKKLLEEQWGTLMETAPRETQQAIQNMVLDKYADWLNLYFYSLARSAKDAKGE